jgi:subtilase family serine protease
MKTATTGAACVALTVAFAAAGATGADAASRSTIPGSQPSWATSKALKSAAPSSDVVHARVYLPNRNQAALDAFTTAVSTPGNASYGKYLTPQQFHQQYSPAQSDVSAVQNWLRSAGFTVVNTPDSGSYVAVEGTVAQANSVFATTLGEYSAYGQTLRAPETAPSVPAELAGKVSAVVGLDDSHKLITSNNDNGNDPKQNHGAPGVGFRAGTPCADWYGQSSVTTNFVVYDDKSTPLAPCGYTPAQVRGLYGLDSTANGAGETVAFVGANASPTLQQDVAEYSTRHGLPAPDITELVSPGVYKHPDTPQQIPGDYYGEETLDAESIHTTAPAAKLLYVGSSNAYQDFDVSINHIVDKGLASIISISYGFGGEAVPQGYINSLNGTFQQAVAEGIGVFVSSGDSGDEKAATGTAQPDFYANSPYVTAVGGTSAAVVRTGTSTAGTIGDRSDALVNAQYWKRQFEVGWQTGLDGITPQAGTAITSGTGGFSLTGTLAAVLPGPFQSGGGGGVSRVFGVPSYQQGVPGIIAGGRNVPDISALADPNTGFLVGQTQQFSDGTYYDEYRLGGTSLAAPLMAGMAADANQASRLAGGQALGFLNPRIYSVYQSSASAALYDVDQKDAFCKQATCTPKSALPALIRVNFVNSENAKDGLTYSVRTEETTSTTLHSVKGYDTATGVGTPNGGAFLTHLVAGK